MYRRVPSSTKGSLLQVFHFQLNLVIIIEQQYTRTQYNSIQRNSLTTFGSSFGGKGMPVIITALPKASAKSNPSLTYQQPKKKKEELATSNCDSMPYFSSADSEESGTIFIWFPYSFVKPINNLKLKV